MLIINDEINKLKKKLTLEERENELN